MTHAIDQLSKTCTRCGAQARHIFDDDLECFAITFHLSNVLPSGEHTLFMASPNCVQALRSLFSKHADAQLPISIRVASE